MGTMLLISAQGLTHRALLKSSCHSAHPPKDEHASHVASLPHENAEISLCFRFSSESLNDGCSKISENIASSLPECQAGILFLCIHPLTLPN